jgi:asparagine synthase (glutamine-hydrolysing)
MCGICGIVDPSRAHDEAVRLTERMAERLHHRGPDDSGVWHDAREGVYLGHTRLAVIDVEGSTQPLETPESDAVLVYNGEIYNFEVLRAELTALGHEFRTRGDTEVLLHAWQEWGKGCLTRLRGMFAFALWDAKERRLLLARDHLGKKPLFYRTTPQGIVFASEIKALLLDPSLSVSPNPAAIDHYLQHLYVAGEETAFKEIRRLPPGSFLEWQGEVLAEGRFWEPLSKQREPMDEVEATLEARRLFDAAVSARLVSDVPLGAWLSGGLDSSLVVALMSRHLRKPVETFSVGFTMEFDELPKAQVIANRYRTSHHTLRVAPPTVELLQTVLACYDEPFADSSAIPVYQLAEFTRRRVTVALVGDGGDELFAGYHRHYRLWQGEVAPRSGVGPRLDRFALRCLAHLGVDLALSSHDERTRLGVLLRRVRERNRRRQYPDPWRRVESLRSTLSHDLRSELWGDRHPARDTRWESGRSSAIEACLDFDLRSYLPGDLLVKVDRAAMAHSLELRSPFLDVDLLEFALRLPLKLLFKRGTTKPFLRQAFRKELPRSIRRQGKMGFGAPVAGWLRTGPLHALARDTLLGSETFLSTLFDRQALRARWENYCADGYAGQQVWTLLCLDLWAQQCGLTPARA